MKMVPQITNLKNGLRVVFVERQGSGTVSVSVRGSAGSVYEQPNEIGVAHMLEHVLLESTEDFSNVGDVSNYVAEVGGRLSAHTDVSDVEYKVNVLSQDAERAFRLISQILIRPRISSESIARNKKVIGQEIQQVLSDPRRRVAEMIPEMLYRGHRLGTIVPGTPQSIDEIDGVAARGFWERLYIPERFIISVCGDISLGDIESYIQKYFFVWETSHTKQVFFDVPEKHTNLEIRIEPRETDAQAFYSIGYYGYLFDDPKRYAALLLAKILGQGATSRLTRVLRNEKAAIYSVNALSVSSKVNGIFSVAGSVRDMDLNETLRDIVNEIKKIALEAPTQEELESARKRLLAGDAFNMEGVSNIASYYSKLFLNDNRATGYENVLRHIESVTPESLRQIAQDLAKQQPKIAILSSTISEADIDLQEA